MSTQPASGPRWGWILAIVGFLLVMAAFGSVGKETAVPDNYQVDATPVVASDTYEPSTTATAPTTGYAGSGVAQVDSTLLPSERENYARDPSSQGFSDSDRDFLREQGVSEEEARAMETIMREHGVE